MFTDGSIFKETCGENIILLTVIYKAILFFHLIVHVLVLNIYEKKSLHFISCSFPNKLRFAPKAIVILIFYF